MLTSMDRDGTGKGFDCELTHLIAETVRIPVIASGGAGRGEHFAQVFREVQPMRIARLSVFHFGMKSIADFKRGLFAAGIPVRLPC